MNLQFLRSQAKRHHKTSQNCSTLRMRALCEALESRVLLNALAPTSIAGDIATIFAFSGANGSQPPQAARVSLLANGHLSQLNLISGQSKTESYTYTANSSTTATAIVVQADHTAIINFTFTSISGGTYASSIPSTSESQAGVFFLQTPPFVQLAPASISGGDLAFTVEGGGGSYQTSGTDSQMLNANGTFDDTSSVSTDDGTYTYKQTVGSTPGIAKLVVNDTSGGPTSFVTLAMTSSTGGFFYRTDAILPNGDSTFNDYQYGTFVLSFPTTHLAFAQQPSTAIAGQTISHLSAITPTLNVDVLDIHGNIVTNDSSNVTIALATLGGTLNGTTTVQAVHGVATFSDLTINNTGGYMLTVTDGALTGVTSKAFTVTPDLASAHLSFSQTPADTLVGKPLFPNLIVKAVDQFGNLITTDHSKIILSTTTGTFTGLNTVALSNGIAKFSNIVFSTVGDYNLIAAPATNSTLAITTPISFAQVINSANTNPIPTPVVMTTGYAFGTPIILSTHLTSNAPASIPFTGSPTLIINGTDNIAATTFSTAGLAKFTVPVLAAGSYDCLIVYNGDVNHDGASSSSFTLLINLATTTTTLTASSNTLVFGQTLTLTAAVKSSQAPGNARTGNIEFFDNSSPLQTIALNGSSNASITFTPSSSGNHSYQAIYVGDTGFAGSTSANLVRTVSRDKTSIELTSSTPSPITLNQTFNLNVHVAVIAPGTGVITGDSVTIKDNGAVLGSFMVDGSGHGSLPGLSFTTSGTHSLTAIFAGDTDTLAVTSSDLKLIVPKAAAAGFQLVLVNKGVTYIQNSTSAATTPALDFSGDSGDYQFQAFVLSSSSGSVLNGTVTPPGGSAIPFNSTGNTSKLELDSWFSSPSDRDTTYPDGNYTVSINTLHFGTKNINVNLAGDDYPAAPDITNYAALQTANVSSPITIQWAAMPGGTTSDFIGLQIHTPTGDGNNTVFQLNTLRDLNGTATSVVIPAGTLQAGQIYVAELVFVKPVSSDSTSYLGAEVLGVYSAFTDFYINNPTNQNV